MWKRTIMVLIIVLSIGYPQWRWANDTIEFTHDKQTHFAGSFGLYYMFKSKDFTDKESFLYTTALGVTKEIIDATLPWEKYGVWGGDGFSKNDLVYNLFGMGLAHTVDKLWKLEENKKYEFRFNISRNYCSFQLVF
jgi:hypothetical protein